MARPTKGSGENRDFVFKVRFTANEKNLLVQLAKQAGLTPSDFVRAHTIGSKPHGKQATPEHAMLIRLQAELN